MGHRPIPILPPPVIPDPTVPDIRRPKTRNTGKSNTIPIYWPPIWPLTKGRRRPAPRPAPPFSYVDQVKRKYVRSDMSPEQLERDLEIVFALEEGEIHALEPYTAFAWMPMLREMEPAPGIEIVKLPRYLKDKDGRYLNLGWTHSPTVGAADEVAGP